MKNTYPPVIRNTFVKRIKGDGHLKRALLYACTIAIGTVLGIIVTYIMEL